MSEQVDYRRAIARDQIHLALVNATARFTSTDAELYAGLVCDLENFILQIRSHVGRASNQPLHDKNAKPQGLR